ASARARSRCAGWPTSRSSCRPARPEASRSELLRSRPPKPNPPARSSLRTMGLLDWLIVRGLPPGPRPIVGRGARRYGPGGTRAHEGAMATLDFLGEEVKEPSKAVATAEEYERALEAIAARGLPSNVSIKPTALGLAIDESLCRSNVERIAAAARKHGNFVRI